MKSTAAGFVLAVIVAIGYAQADSPWYERFSLRGYTQLRYAQLHDLSAAGAIWSSGGLSIRRGRLILSGFVSDNVFIYIQPDFAASFSSSLNVMQLRDAYFDVFLDSVQSLRVRVGQSKIPFGYENMQSSSLRLPIERAEVLNTASVPGERDIGVFFMWAPPAARALYRQLLRNGLKGSGDYGCISLGVYNGQGINRPELNRTLYWNARATYPFEIGSAIVEPAVQAYIGRFVQQTSTSVQQTAADYRDERYAVTLAISPAPVGVLAEYAWGHTPRYVPPSNGGGGYIRSGRIEGGFVTVYSRAQLGGYVVMPFVRWQTLHGGVKSLVDAPMTDLVQAEAGVEWHISNTLELTAEYMHTDRRTQTTPGNGRQRTDAVWLQLQINY
ncbi:MAG: OprO/OprP family phosphate-selective porin [Chlorobi bacterium]|nr:OprO/OprP family phosphate-selective porin [Chlorobiota bacterium]